MIRHLSNQDATFCPRLGMFHVIVPYSYLVGGMYGSGGLGGWGGGGGDGGWGGGDGGWGGGGGDGGWGGGRGRETER